MLSIRALGRLEEVNFSRDVSPALSSRSSLKDWDPIFTETSISSRESIDEIPEAYDPKSISHPWRGLANQDVDTAFWCQSTGTVLAQMMDQAGYSSQIQQTQLAFFGKYVAPGMGRRPKMDGSPRCWQSFMSDDFSPVELSWCWKPGSRLPVVRYAVEPIGRWTGSAHDPLNLRAAHDMIEKAKDTLVGLDLGWWKMFSQDMVVQGTDDPVTRSNTDVDASEMSQVFLAFDLQGEKVALKAYFLPMLKAHQTATSHLNVIRRTMDKVIIQQSGMTRAFATLSQFIESRQNEGKIDVEIVAIDCVEPSKSRVKIYVRCRLTTFDSVVDVMTMDGLLDSEESRSAIKELRELWGLVLGLEADFSSSTPLKSREHRTAGVLYYFELKPGQATPSPKVYIPVKHYGVNDFEIARGVSTFLQARGQGFSNKEYLSVMRDIFNHRDLKDGAGIQSYISCAFSGPSVVVTSYVNPEIYQTRRFARYGSSLSGEGSDFE